MKTKTLFKYFLPVVGVSALVGSLLAIPFVANNQTTPHDQQVNPQSLTIQENTPWFVKIYDNQDLRLHVQIYNLYPNTLEYHWYYLDAAHAYQQDWVELSDHKTSELLIPAPEVHKYNNCEFKCVVFTKTNQVLLTSHATYVQVVPTAFKIQVPSTVYADQNGDFNLNVHLKTDSELKNDRFEFNWYKTNETQVPQLVQSSPSSQLILKSPKASSFWCVVKDLTTNHTETSSVIQVNHTRIHFVQHPQVTNMYVEPTSRTAFLQINNPHLNQKVQGANVRYELYGWDKNNSSWARINYQSYWSNWISFTQDEKYSSYKLKAIYQNNSNNNLCIYAESTSNSFGLKTTNSDDISINNNLWNKFITGDFRTDFQNRYLTSDGIVQKDSLEHVAALIGINQPAAVKEIHCEIQNGKLKVLQVYLKSSYHWTKYAKTLLNYGVQIHNNVLVWTSSMQKTVAINNQHTELFLSHFAAASSKDLPIWEMIDSNGNVLPQYLSYFTEALGISHPDVIAHMVLLRNKATDDGNYTLNIIIVLKPHFKWDPKIKDIWPDSTIDGPVLAINNIPLDILVHAPVNINYGLLTNYIASVNKQNYQQKLFVSQSGDVEQNKLSSFAKLIGISEPQVITSIKISSGTQKMVDGHYTIKLIIKLKQGVKWDLAKVLEGCCNLPVSLTDQGLIIDNIQTNAGLTAVNFDYQKCANWIKEGFTPKYIKNLESTIKDLLSHQNYNILGTVLGVNPTEAINNITFGAPSDTPVNPATGFYYLNVSISLKTEYKWILPNPLPSPFISVNGNTLTVKYLETSIPAIPHIPQPAPQPAFQIAKVANGLGRNLETFYSPNNNVLTAIVPSVFGNPNNLAEQQWLAEATLGISQAASQKITQFNTWVSQSSENGNIRFNLTATLSDNYRWDLDQIQKAIFNYHGSDFEINISNQGKTLTLYNLWSNVPDLTYASQNLVNWTGWKTTAQAFEFNNILPIIRDMIYSLGGTSKEFNIADRSSNPELVKQICSYLGISNWEGVNRIRLTFQGAHNINILQPALPDWIHLPYQYYQQLNVTVDLIPGWHFTPQSLKSAPLSWEGSSSISYADVSNPEPWICRSFLIGIPGYPVNFSIAKIKSTIYNAADQWKYLLNTSPIKSVSWSSSDLSQINFVKQLGNCFGISTEGDPLMDNMYPISSINWRATNTPGYYALTIKLCVDKAKWYCFDGSLSTNAYNPYPSKFQCSWNNVQDGGYIVYPFDYWMTIFFKL